MLESANDLSDYCQCARLLRVYLTRYLLPPDAEKATTYSFSKGPYRLTVIMHPRIAMIQEVKLDRAGRSVGIIGIWHHGVEEVFFVHKMLGQPHYQSLRQTQNATIERGLRWLCMHLMQWQDTQA